jgi:hypothetical protein
LLRTVQNSEEEDFFANFVDCNERKRREGNLSRAMDATRAADVWKRFQRADTLHYRLCHASRGLRTVLCDEIADPFKIVRGVRRPADAHQPR